MSLGPSDSMGNSILTGPVLNLGSVGLSCRSRQRGCDMVDGKGLKSPNPIQTKDAVVFYL